MSESTAVPTHAQSAAIAAFGEPDQLTLGESAVPAPGAGQVLLRIHAAGVNPLDWKIRRGLMQQAFPVTLPHVLGVEGAARSWPPVPG